MSDTQRLNLSLEVQDTGADPAGDSPAGETAANGGVAIDTSATPAKDSKSAAERPAWLPEGFDSPEAMAKAYTELRTKMSKEGAPKGEKSTDDKAGTPKIEKAADDKASTPDPTAAIRDAVVKAAGDEAQFKATLEWAKANASDAAVATYNAALETGKPELAALAFAALKAERTESEGEDPALIEGETTGRTAGVRPFASQLEMTKAMSDPRYKEGDPAYHREIEKRLEVSNDIW